MLSVIATSLAGTWYTYRRLRVKSASLPRAPPEQTTTDGYLHVSEYGKFRRSNLDEFERLIGCCVMETVFRSRIRPVLKLRLGPHAAPGVSQSPGLMPALRRVFTNVTIEVLAG